MTFKDKVGSVRYRRYRVVKPADSRAGVGSGQTDKVTVYGWRTLTSLSPALGSGLGETSSVTVNGIAYPDSISSFGNGTPGMHIDYNLNRDCKQLEARYGISDSSPANGTASLSLVADSTAKYSGSFGLTQSALVTTDVTGVFRITINASVAMGGIAAVASPRVLCSF